MAADMAHVSRLEQRLREGVFAKCDHVELNGPNNHTQRYPGNVNLSFAFIEGESMLMGLHDIAVSSGSACTSASLEPSYVLRALGVDDTIAHSSIRFGLGRFSTEEEVDLAVKQVTTCVASLREMSPLYEMVQEGIDLKSIQWSQH
jgi:cysteine desulfurase